MLDGQFFMLFLFHARPALKENDTAIFHELKNARFWPATDHRAQKIGPESFDPGPVIFVGSIRCGDQPSMSCWIVDRICGDFAFRMANQIAPIIM